MLSATELNKSTEPPSPHGSGGAKNAIAAAVGNRPTSEPTVEKISIRHLNFYYEDGNHALRDVTLPIYDKRVTAFMGPSGCGKSTLLRAISGVGLMVEIENERTSIPSIVNVSSLRKRAKTL